MYNAIIFILLGTAALLLIWGVHTKSIRRMVGAVMLGILTVAFFAFMSFWGEMLWFDAIGYGDRFWTQFWMQVVLAVAGGAIGAAVLFGLTWKLRTETPFVRLGAMALAAFVGANWGFAQWATVLKYYYGENTGTTEPILNADVSFYLFSLPFYDSLYQLLFSLAFIGLLAGGLSLIRVKKAEDLDQPWEQLLKERGKIAMSAILPSAVLLLFVLAFGKYLDRFHLMYSATGVVSGPGWTDVNVLLPAYWVVVVVTTLTGIVLLAGPVRRQIRGYMTREGAPPERGDAAMLLSAAGVLVIVWILALGVVPAMFQWLIVKPNEITYEKPYIKHNINFTRLGFKLHETEEREYPATGKMDTETVKQNEGLFDNVRLWDYRALDAVYQQFQEIRLYYEFVDVDIDRYRIADEYRQVMVSAREMQPSNLPEGSQTFVNRRFKYTHGYGLTLTTVSEFTPQGLPHLLIKDIPPKAEYPSLEVKRPQLYYGELTDSHVVVNSKEPEFDYPKGQKNEYIKYPGTGGVQLTNLWRKFLYGWKFDGTKFFLSGYPTSESRIMFHREIGDRVKTLAPFLFFDQDPYVVMVDGKIYWIVDGYASSPYYPYSEPFKSREVIEYKEQREARALSTEVGRHLDGARYLRNSVKAVVDAFEGTVDFYIFEPEDPIIKVWDTIFPGLFKKREQMPEDLFSHVRYPADMLLVQGLVYAKYHMTDPTVFYNQEDLWIRATEKYYGYVQPVEPYYIMWELPGTDELQFVLILPFTPKNRQVLIGWIAGMCDGDNYGRFLAYKFPKEKRILGPQQVETKIDQDSYLSGQLTLWDQRGSNVIRGNVLAIPVEKTLFYVEPIYLQAETAAYPELRLVAVMYQDELSYAESFDEALAQLFEKDEPEKVAKEELPATEALSTQALVKKADAAFDDYLESLSRKEFQKGAEALERLQNALESLTRAAGVNAQKQEAQEQEKEPVGP